MEPAFAAPAFSVSVFRFTLALRDKLLVPVHKGSTLRGGFGTAFKSIVCPHPQDCNPRCQQGSDCPFGYVFQTAPPVAAPVLRALNQIPRPFVIEPPWDQRTVYEPDETLSFQVILIGEACRYLSYFVLAFHELGRRGLGGRQSRFQLVQVEAIQPLTGQRATVYDYTVSTDIRNEPLPVGWDEIVARTVGLPTRQLTLNFMTPTRLLEQKRPAVTPRFYLLIGYLLGRASSLSTFFCGTPLEVDFKAFKERAGRVEIVQNDSVWQDWDRHSRRQGQAVKMGGLVGRVTYAGPLAEFLPLLTLGELIHVGKGVVFGNGMYRLTAF